MSLYAHFLRRYIHQHQNHTKICTPIFKTVISHPWMVNKTSDLLVCGFPKPFAVICMNQIHEVLHCEIVIGNRMCKKKKKLIKKGTTIWYQNYLHRGTSTWGMEPTTWKHSTWKLQFTKGPHLVSKSYEHTINPCLYLIASAKTPLMFWLVLRRNCPSRFRSRSFSASNRLMEEWNQGIGRSWTGSRWRRRDEWITPILPSATIAW